MCKIRLLLHMCCAPCSVYPVSELLKEEVELEGLFYNPNIHPREEFEKRRENVVKFSLIDNISVNFIDEFKQDIWGKFGQNEELRCNMCYSMRLDRAASYAAEKGFDAYSTTLLVSPYQKHELIKGLGQKYADKYGVDFLYRDFRPGFRRGQQQAREMGLYRQKFCGCIMSWP